MPRFGARFDDGTAFVKTSALDGGDEARRLCGLLVKMLIKTSQKKGWCVDILDNEGLSLRVQGKGALALIHEQGVHKFITSSGKGGKRHTSYCKVDVEPWVARTAQSLREQDIDFKAQKCGGPGGQHVNKTESAMRAVHRPTGIGVLCSSERSQAENKRIAIQWLAAKIEQAERGEQARGKREAWASSTRSGAGEAMRTYWMDEDRCVDQGSGSKARASDVLAGSCSSFWV